MPRVLHHGRVYPGQFMEPVRGCFQRPTLPPKRAHYFTALLFAGPDELGAFIAENSSCKEGGNHALSAGSDGQSGAYVGFSPIGLVTEKSAAPPLGAKLGVVAFEAKGLSLSRVAHEAVHLATNYRRAILAQRELRRRGWPKCCGEDRDREVEVYCDVFEGVEELRIPSTDRPESEEFLAYCAATCQVQLIRLIFSWGHDIDLEPDPVERRVR